MKVRFLYSVFVRERGNIAIFSEIDFEAPKTFTFPYRIVIGILLWYYIGII